MASNERRATFGQNARSKQTDWNRPSKRQYDASRTSKQSYMLETDELDDLGLSGGGSSYAAAACNAISVCGSSTSGRVDVVADGSSVFSNAVGSDGALVRIEAEAETQEHHFIVPMLVDSGSSASFLSPGALPDPLANEVLNFINYNKEASFTKLKKMRINMSSVLTAKAIEMKSELFAEKFYFQVNFKQSETNCWPFNVFTFVTDVTELT